MSRRVAGTEEQIRKLNTYSLHGLMGNIFQYLVHCQSEPSDLSHAAESSLQSEMAT